MSNIIEQLCDIYELENWHINRLTREQLVEYFIRMIAQGNVVVFMDDDRLAGYIEFYRINPEQWRRLMNREEFYAFDEDIENGEICYINSIFILEEYRKTQAIKLLKQLFFDLNSHCKYFVGIDNRHNKRIRQKGALYGRRQNDQ